MFGISHLRVALRDLNGCKKSKRQSRITICCALIVQTQLFQLAEPVVPLFLAPAFRICPR